MQPGSNENRGHIFALQGHFLTCSHDLSVLVALIIIPAKMKQAMNHIQDQLVPRWYFQAGRHVQRGLSQHDKFTGQLGLPGLGQQEADDVGGAIMIEVRHG